MIKNQIEDSQPMILLPNVEDKAYADYFYPECEALVLDKEIELDFNALADADEVMILYYKEKEEYKAYIETLNAKGYSVEINGFENGEDNPEPMMILLNR